MGIRYNLKISLKRETIVAKMPDVLDELAGRHPLIEEVLKLSEAQVRTTLDPKHRAYSAGLHATDRYVKRQLTKVLDRSTPEGQVFFEDEAELRKPTAPPTSRECSSRSASSGTAPSRTGETRSRRRTSA